MSAGKTGNHLMISDSKLLAMRPGMHNRSTNLRRKRAKIRGKYPSGGPPGGRDVRADDVESMRDALPKDGLFSSEHTRLLPVCMTSRLPNR